MKVGDYIAENYGDESTQKKWNKIKDKWNKW